MAAAKECSTLSQNAEEVKRLRAMEAMESKDDPSPGQPNQASAIALGEALKGLSSSERPYKPAITTAKVNSVDIAAVAIEMEVCDL